jgi:hypothetical protein
MRWLSDEELAEYEGLQLGSLSRVFGPVQKQLGAAMPGAAQGAAAGTAFGPWGALIGAGVGGLSGLSQKSGKGGADRKPAPTPTPPVAEPTPSTPNSASGQLAQLLQNPVLQQAIAAIASGQSGATASGVPAGALLGALGTLATEAAYEAELQDGADGYLRGPDGRWIVDPSSPAERAALVLGRLNEADSQDDDACEYLLRAGFATRLT